MVNILINMASKQPLTLATAEAAFLKAHRAEMAADADPRCTTERHARCIAASDRARKVRNEIRDADGGR